MEGLHEQVFLKYLKIQYNRGSGVRVSIKNGRGGSPDYLADQAIKDYSDYDKTFIIYDTDKCLSTNKHNKILELDIGIIKNKKCLESVLLSIKKNEDFSRRSSAWCKKEFQDNYIPRRERGDIMKYKKVFPRPLLEKMREKNKNLKQLILIIEGTG